MDTVVGLHDVRAEVVMLQAPNDTTKLELSNFTSPSTNEDRRLRQPTSSGGCGDMGHPPGRVGVALNQGREPFIVQPVRAQHGGLPGPHQHQGANRQQTALPLPTVSVRTLPDWRSRTQSNGGTGRLPRHLRRRVRRHVRRHPARSAVVRAVPGAASTHWHGC